MSENKYQAPMRQAADDFIRDLTDRTSPLLDFYPGGELAAPINAVSGRGYSGLNRVLLSGGGADPRWFTKKQAQEAGYQLDENAQGRQAVYWEFKETRAALDDQGRPVLDEAGRTVTETVERDRPALRLYTLYHASELRLENGQPLPAHNAPARPFGPDRLESIIRGSGLTIEHDQRNLSFYRAKDDSVHLMPPDAYPDNQVYATELLKTLARASRSRDRLNRPCGPLGSETYAKEELRIVLSSIMMAQDLGLPFVRDNNESYAKVWGEILEKDPYELAKAGRDAERIKEYVMSLGQNLETERQRLAGLEQANANQSEHQLKLDSEQGIIKGLKQAVEKQSLEIVQHIDYSLKQSISGGKDFTSEEHLILNKSPMLWESGTEVDEAARQEVYANQKARENEFWRTHPYLMSTAPLTPLVTDIRLTIIASKRHTGEEAKEKENEAWQDVAKKIEEYERKHLQQEKEAVKEPAAEKTLLNVPFKDKEEAKGRGAKWSRDDKLWYAPAGTDLGPLARWIPENTPEPVKNMSPAEEFAQALEADGLILDGPPIMDGEMHRVRVVGGRPGSLDGAYFGHLDGRPNGMIFNHREGSKTKFLATGQVLTEEQKNALKIEAAEKLAQREKERQAMEIKAIDKARAKWNKSLLPSEQFTHPYLKAKNLEELSLKNLHEDEQGNLMIPLYNAEGVFRSMQTVSPEGQKQFENGCSKTGNMHVIGDGKDGKPDGLKKTRPPQIYISEGYATGASVFMATENPMVVAFDANNLKAVAMAVREILPEANITICADNDHARDKNVGLEKAKDAAQAVGGEVVAPEFTPEEMDRVLTDFNDLHQSRGLGAVRQFLGQRQSLGRAAAQVKASVSSNVKSAGMGL